MGNTSWSGTRRSFPAKTRRLILRRDPTCTLRLPGCTGISTEADHITPHAAALRAGWSLADIDDPTNGQGVCSSCHTRKSRAEATAGRRQQAARHRAARTRPTQPHPGLTNPTPEGVRRQG